MVPLNDRHAADVFGLTYREFAAAKPSHYKWRVLAMDAVSHLRRAADELWSHEKMAEYVHIDAKESARLRGRFEMSRKANEGNKSSDRIFILIREWLGPFEKDERERIILARDLSRLLASQLQLASDSGEKLEDVALGLEGEDMADFGTGATEKSEWGPKWKD